MLIYNKKGDFFELSKIIALVKRILYVYDVSYISGKHWEYEEQDPYYKFYFDSLNQYSEKKWIISYKCRVKSKRNLYYFYVNDKEFTNETIYYILDIDDYTITRKKLCSSKEDSSLIKKENKFYFFFNESQECSDKMKNILKKYDFIGVKTIILDFRQIHIENDIVLGWNKCDIYYGKIYHYPNYKLEIIKKISKEYEILSVIPNNSLIIYSYKKYKRKIFDENEEEQDSNNDEEESFNKYIKEEDNDKDSLRGEEDEEDNGKMDLDEDDI